MVWNLDPSCVTFSGLSTKKHKKLDRVQCILPVHTTSTIRGCIFHYRQAFLHRFASDEFLPDCRLSHSSRPSNRPSLPTLKAPMNHHLSPMMCNHHESVLTGLPRSSNIAEGWHNGFASMLSVPSHPIWHFIDCLKIEQGLTECKIVKKQMKEPAAPR